MRKLFFIFIFLLYSIQINAASYTFGVVPQFEEENLKRMWDPFINYLNKQTGNNFIFKTTKSIVDFETNLSKGLYDFVYLTPSEYIKFHQSQGYSAFAKVKDLKLRWIVFATNNSHISSINDLSHRQVLFPELDSPIIINPLKTLEKKGINVTPIYIKTHEEIYNSVSQSLYNVGIGIDHTFKIMPNSVRSNLKIIWTSDSFQPNAFASHPRVPFDVVDNLRNVLINIADTDDNRMILDTIRFCTGFEVAKDSDWNSIREMEIKNDKE